MHPVRHLHLCLAAIGYPHPGIAQLVGRQEQATQGGKIPQEGSRHQGGQPPEDHRRTGQLGRQYCPVPRLSDQQVQDGDAPEARVLQTTGHHVHFLLLPTIHRYLRDHRVRRSVLD
uniref:(northern house mosquito) hypothetical protein n=1 Tax=Culex pipiens TaxID=7175 RepID=A0A8D8JGC3_CULPI